MVPSMKIDLTIFFVFSFFQSVAIWIAVPLEHVSLANAFATKVGPETSAPRKSATPGAKCMASAPTEPACAPTVKI